MDNNELEALLGRPHDPQARRAVASYLLPAVTALREDRIGHDLAPDTLELLSGTFTPAGRTVRIDVEAAYSFLGNARAALILYVGQPDVPGACLYDSGGAPLEGVRWYPAGSLNGESAWADTTARRIVLDVDPNRPVTWQVLGGIIGGAEQTPVPGARWITITPDSRTAFVTSPDEHTVTPIALGAPGYSTDSSKTVEDRGEASIPLGGAPGRLASDDRYVVVCRPADECVTILGVAERAVVRDAPVRGRPVDCAVMPDGSSVLVTTGAGVLARVSLPDGAVDEREIGGSLSGVTIAADGTAAWTTDTEAGVVHRIELPDLAVTAGIAVPHRPTVVRTAPDGTIWVLCDPAEGPGRVVGIDPVTDEVIADHALPFPHPTDMAIVPVEGQSSDIVRTAWVSFRGDRYAQLLIGGLFAGQVHSFHHGSFAAVGEAPEAAGEAPTGIALNDFGEIWLTQPYLDRVWKWPGGRFVCRADPQGWAGGIFFGEYCEVSVYGALDTPRPVEDEADEG